MRKFILKSIPYLMAFFGGILMYFLSLRHIHNDSVNDLVSNVAANLIAIPIMFLLYDYSNYKLSTKLNNTLFEGFSFEINSSILKLLRNLHKIMGIKKAISWIVIENMLDKKAKDIKNSIKISVQDIENFKLYKKNLDDLIYKSARSSVMGDNQIKFITEICKNLSHIINETEFRGDKKSNAEYIQNILVSIDNWFETCEEEALKSHKHFQLMETVGEDE